VPPGHRKRGRGRAAAGDTVATGRADAGRSTAVCGVRRLVASAAGLATLESSHIASCSYRRCHRGQAGSERSGSPSRNRVVPDGS
jgi:hypothetical protein